MYEEPTLTALTYVRTLRNVCTRCCNWPTTWIITASFFLMQDGLIVSNGWCRTRAERLVAINRFSWRLSYQQSSPFGLPELRTSNNVQGKKRSKIVEEKKIPNHTFYALSDESSIVSGCHNERKFLLQQTNKVTKTLQRAVLKRTWNVSKSRTRAWRNIGDVLREMCSNKTGKNTETESARSCWNISLSSCLRA